MITICRVNRSLCSVHVDGNYSISHALTKHPVLARDLHMNVDRGRVVIEGRPAGVQAFILLCELRLEDHCVPVHLDGRATAPETQVTFNYRHNYIFFLLTKTNSFLRIWPPSLVRAAHFQANLPSKDMKLHSCTTYIKFNLFLKGLALLFFANGINVH